MQECACVCVRTRVPAPKHECDCVFLQGASACLFVCPCAFCEQLCMNFLHRLLFVCVCVWCCGVGGGGVSVGGGFGAPLLSFT